MKRTSLVATLTSPLSEDGAELRSLPEGVDWLEVRADLVGEMDADWLRDRFDGGLIYTLRSKAEGGQAEGGRSSRLRRLGGAAETYDLVDLEADRDCVAEILERVPAESRLISWHGPSTHLTGLKERFTDLSATRARFYKMIPFASQSGDGIRVLALLDSVRRDDFVCFAAGDIGSWTRVLAPRLGCPLVYGAFGDPPGAPGQWTVQKLSEDYGLPWLPEIERVCGIVGRPVSHSLSPKLHNGAYRALGVPAVYVALHVETFGDFWLEVVESGSMEILGLPLRGFSVTSPHKEVALAVSGASSPRSQHIEAANTLVWHDEVWEAETTDPDGVVMALARAGVELRGRKAAVVGCGGAGKAAAYGLQLAGAKVTLINRSKERGKKASMELALPFEPLDGFDPGAYDVVIQATALGHDPEDPFVFDPERLSKDAAVLDMVYSGRPTRLLQRIRDLGRVGVDGREMLLYQALEQFRLMNGRELDENLARDLLGIPAPATTAVVPPNRPASRDSR